MVADSLHESFHKSEEFNYKNSKNRYSVTNALDIMKNLIRHGKMLEAITIGEQAKIPLAIDHSEITFENLINQGSESKIYDGKWLDKRVVIKKAIIRNEDDLIRYRKELKILSEYPHPNIISIYGARALPPHYYIVMPKEDENLYNAIHNLNYRPEWKDILDIGIQLTEAVHEIHKNGIIHRDIKTKNILLNNINHKIKLIDFGLAIYFKDINSVLSSYNKPTGGFHKTNMVGTLEYMAPEILMKDCYSYSADVYAVAVTLNEIASGIYPYTDCRKENPDAHTILEMGYSKMDLTSAVVADGLRPTLPTSYPLGYDKIMKMCWELDPMERPDISEVNLMLKKLRSNLDLSIPKGFISMSFLYKNEQKMDFEDFEAIENIDLLKEELKEKYRPIINQKLTIGSFETAGRRGIDKMEDRKFIISPFLGSQSSALIGIFDGHRGSEAAEFAKENLPMLILQYMKIKDNIEEVLNNAFLHLEQKFEQTEQKMICEPKGIRYPGTTALVTLILNNKIYTANSGDCRALLSRNGMSCQLTRDHIIEDKDEFKRLINCGANLKQYKNAFRVGDAGIQVSRSLGDIDLKSSGIIAEPEVTVTAINDRDDDFLILGTDGLFETLSNEDLIKLIQDTVKHPDMCAKRLVTYSVDAGSNDNITCIVLFLKQVSTLEQVYDTECKYDVKFKILYKKDVLIAADEMEEVF